MDTKTKTLLDEYRKKKKGAENATKKESTGNGDSKEEKEEAEVKKEKDEETKEESSEELDEDSKREDRVASAGLEAIMREYAFELAKEPIKLSEPGLF